MEKKFPKYPLLQEQYVDFMNEYEALRQMSGLSSRYCDDNNSYNYLRHYAVTKEESTTTKLVVVFDGSAKTTTGISLNACTR